MWSYGEPFLTVPKELTGSDHPSAMTHAFFPGVPHAIGKGNLPGHLFEHEDLKLDGLWV